MNLQLIIALNSALLVSLYSSACTANGPQISGEVTNVRDVDTIELGGVAIRLNGIDGPELSTDVGQARGHIWTEVCVRTAM